MKDEKLHRTQAGALLFEIAMRSLALGFKLRALGQRQGTVTRWGGGSWGVMRSLALGGPQTVPALARARPVARQRIQLIADELAARGLVAFHENPAHRRSKLLRLTAQGERVHAELTRAAAETADRLALGMDAEALAVTAATLARMAERVDAALGAMPETAEETPAPRKRKPRAGGAGARGNVVRSGPGR
jgi:DNA-binding MarR family transcriptional regulator